MDPFLLAIALRLLGKAHAMKIHYAHHSSKKVTACGIARSFVHHDLASEVADVTCAGCLVAIVGYPGAPDRCEYVIRGEIGLELGGKQPCVEHRRAAE